MSAYKRTRTDRPQLRSVAHVSADRPHKGRLVLLLAALLALTLALAPRADAFVYWIGNQGEPGTIEEANPTIGRANLDGSDVKRDFIVLPGRGGGGGMAVDGTHLHWAKTAIDEPHGDIGRANLDGTSPNQTFITDVNMNFRSGVAVDDEHIYWVTAIAGGTGGIGRANLDGTGVEENFITGLDFPADGLAVDGSHVYWTSTSPESIGNPYDHSNRIGRANRDGTGVDENFIGTAPHYPVAALAIDDSHVWWAHSGRFAGGIARANLDGTGAESVIFDNGQGPYPCGVAVTDTHLYWNTQGSIGRANLDGSRPSHELITIPARPGQPVAGCGIAVDALGPPPSNDFRFAQAKKNRRQGTAKLAVVVPGPGELDLAKTRKVKPDAKTAEAAGREKLLIKPRRKAKRTLREEGKAKVKAVVTYTPDGGEPNTQTKRVRLIKRG
jgi:hypothetical protein